MIRQILLIEPNYKNKYPPIGLMKIATYHRLLGDRVTFYKGDIEDFIIGEITEQVIDKISNIDSTINWRRYSVHIKSFIKNRSSKHYTYIPVGESREEVFITSILTDYADYYRKKKYRDELKYDRVYVATLFTFYWDITIKTINDAKFLVKDISQLIVGGVMASLLTNEIELETGIKPIAGLLDRPGLLDHGNTLIIDDLSLDYSILDEVDYIYPTQSAYFTFMTKGCTRTCAFCSVPKLEPTYKPHIETISKFVEINDRYGEQQNLLLMDNNILASPYFEEIITEIQDMGFIKGATFKEPNQLEIAIKNLISTINDRAYIRRAYALITNLLNNIKGSAAQEYYDVLDQYRLLHIEDVKKDNLIKAYPLIKSIYEKYRNKTPKFRYVDFNQGVDCRYIDENKMKLISQIPIRPLRIAFDYIGLKDKYIKAVELAAKYNITELSNYILYNFTDKPADLYKRLQINVELVERLGIHIYSFPMKYIPLTGEAAKSREHIGPHWNRKYIRSIQAILNVTKGIVAPGRKFFEKAFGKNIDEFLELLYMPESYIIYRKYYEESGKTAEWRTHFRSLNKDELDEAKDIIAKNDFSLIEHKTKNLRIINLLNFYLGPKKHPKIIEDERKKQVRDTYKVIDSNTFMDLTITYDHEHNDHTKRVGFN